MGQIFFNKHMVMWAGLLWFIAVITVLGIVFLNSFIIDRQLNTFKEEQQTAISYIIEEALSDLVLDEVE